MSSVNGISSAAVMYQQQSQQPQKQVEQEAASITAAQVGTDTITLSEEGRKLAEGTVSPLSAGGTQLPPLPTKPQ